MLFTSAKLKEDYMTERLSTQIAHASAVAEHSISTGHNIKWDHFEILQACSGSFWDLAAGLNPYCQELCLYGPARAWVIIYLCTME